MKNSLRTTLILLVPCLISAQIQVEIVPGSDDRNPDVVVSGTDRAKASDIDLQAFQLTENSVQENLARMELTWKRVKQVNINHASAEGYRDLFITLKPISARILRSNDKMKTVNKVHIRNQGSKARSSKPIMRREITETMTTKWHEIKHLSVGSDIKHLVGFNRLVHSSKYGEEDHASKTVMVGAVAENGPMLQPGESVQSELQVKETTVEVRIDYEVSLDGDIYFGYLCDWLFCVCAKHTHIDINDYMKKKGQSPVLQPYEIVTFTYYHDPQVKFGEVKKNTVPVDRNTLHNFNSLKYEQIHDDDLIH